MLIDVEDKVIILDEAHNMEDSAREAASLSLTQVHITNVLEEITELGISILIYCAVCVVFDTGFLSVGGQVFCYNS